MPNLQGMLADQKLRTHRIVLLYRQVDSILALRRLQLGISLLSARATIGIIPHTRNWTSRCCCAGMWALTWCLPRLGLHAWLCPGLVCGNSLTEGRVSTTVTLHPLQQMVPFYLHHPSMGCSGMAGNPMKEGLMLGLLPVSQLAAMYRRSFRLSIISFFKGRGGGGGSTQRDPSSRVVLPRCSYKQHFTFHLCRRASVATGRRGLPQLLCQ